MHKQLSIQGRATQTNSSKRGVQLSQIFTPLNAIKKNVLLKPRGVEQEKWGNSSCMLSIAARKAKFSRCVFIFCDFSPSIRILPKYSKACYIAVYRSCHHYIWQHWRRHAEQWTKKIMTARRRRRRRNKEAVQLNSSNNCSSHWAERMCFCINWLCDKPMCVNNREVNNRDTNFH